MPLPYSPSGVKVRAAGQMGSGEFGMIFHYSQGSGGDITDADAATFAGDVHTAWASHISPYVVDTTILTSVVVEGLGSATDGVGAWGGSEPGTGSGDVPANVCVLEKDTIAARYRGGHPRHYWPAPTSGYLVDPTHLSAAGVTAYQNAITAFHNEVVTAGGLLWTPGTFFYGCLSYYTGGALRPSPIFRPIFGWTVESMLATQRRRIGR